MRRLIAGGIGAIVVMASIPAAALAAPPASTTPRSIAVSVPSDPVPFSPGQTGRVMIRVLDPTSTPVTVTVTGMGINLGDNGQVSFTGVADPRWGGRTDFPQGELTIPSMAYVDVYITVHMPAAISPDLYYIGFVVRPLPTGTGVQVVNQIGGFFTIDVPGPRFRSLSADLSLPGFNFGPIHIPGVVIGDHVAGQLNVHNTGAAAVRFWGENDVTTWGNGTPTQQRIAKSLVPIARSRTFPVSASPGFLVDDVSLAVSLSYPGTTDSSTKGITITRHVLVISPWVLLVLALVVALFIAWRVRARMRRAPRARDRAPETVPKLPRAA
jgi:hypothetical protein